MVWCYRHAGLQLWQSKREAPTDDDWSLYQQMMAPSSPALVAEEDLSSSVGASSSNSSSCSSMEELVPKAKQRKISNKGGRSWQTADLPSNKTIIPILRKLDIIVSDDHTVTLFSKLQRAPTALHDPSSLLSL
jgi:hypothetical protein